MAKAPTVQPTLHTVGGGKGGVGKSTLASGIACVLGRTGRRVVLVDGDVTQGALYLYVGLQQPPVGLREFLAKPRARLLPYVQPVEGLPFDFVAAGRETLGMGRLPLHRTRRLVRALKTLPYDDVVIDLAAGSSAGTVDLYAAGDQRYLVTTPDPAALFAAFGFAKTALFRAYSQMLPKDSSAQLAARSLFSKLGVVEAPAPAVIDTLDASAGTTAVEVRQRLASRILVNMATAAEALKVAQALAKVTHDRLGMNSSFCGGFAVDRSVTRAQRSNRPWFVECQRAYRALASRVLAAPTELHTRSVAEKTTYVIGFNEEVVHNGRSLHVQTEDLGSETNEMLTLVYVGGKILFKARGQFKGDCSEPATRATQVAHQHRTVLQGIVQGRLDASLEQMREAS